MTCTVIFDIETVPDIASGRRLHNLHDISDDDVVRAMRHLQYQKRGSEFMPLHLHRVVAISALVEQTTSDRSEVRVGSYGQPGTDDEAELVAGFFKTIESKEPRLVSWNGFGFDLPVLNYRALLHGIQAPAYWEQGNRKREYRYANYQNRYHPDKNLDLMDRLARSQYGAGLDDISKMLGLPGKSDMHGDDVYDAWRAGDIDAIRAYCESDVLNTYLIYLRYEHMCGNLNDDEHERRCERLKEVLENSDQPHLEEFLRLWNAEHRTK